MKNIKRKELLWMLAPCLLLIGAGAYFSRRPAKEFQIVIDEAKLMPATPYEVSKGYDTRLVVKTRLINLPRGEEPSPNLNYRQHPSLVIIYAKNGKKTAQLSGYDAICWKARREDLTDNRIYGLKLADVPVSLGRLDLRVMAYGDQLNYSLRRVVRKTPEISLILPLRQAGQHIALPQPNKTRPFKLKNITSQWGISSKSRGWLVTIHLTLLDDSVTEKILSERTLDNIVLNAGKRHFSGQKVFFFKRSSTHIEGKSAEINFYVDAMYLPPGIRDSTFKADLSVSDCWPLPITIALHNDGKNITQTQPATK